MLRFHNSLSNTVEEFHPLTQGVALVYTCGPTVYDFVHIGNFRSYVFADTLRRALEREGYLVRQIMNVTDIGHLAGDADEGEDKMVSALKRLGKPETLQSLHEVGGIYADAFKEDLKKLNIEAPESLLRASEHIEAQITLIKTLMERGYAYQTSNGVYFDTQKLPSYGKLKGATYAENSQGARVAINPEKHDQRDFALWKLGTTDAAHAGKREVSSHKESAGAIGWESPWGVGFPGWHTECAAMSMRYLGESFDIHTGGEDLKFPHHENEMAQAEASTRKTFVRYFLHNAFLVIDGEKMAKSKQNFFTLREVEARGISPLALRYFYLAAHYRTTLNFTWDALDAAARAYLRLVRFAAEHKDERGSIAEQYRTRFNEVLNDDMNTPQALAALWDMLKDDMLTSAEKLATLLDMDQALGLLLADATRDTVANEKIPPQVQELLAKRNEARDKKEWDRADTLRKEIQRAGFEVEDSESGPVLRAVGKIKP